MDVLEACTTIRPGLYGVFHVSNLVELSSEFILKEK